MLIHAIVKVLFGHYREMYKFAIGTVMFMMSIFVDYLDTDVHDLAIYPSKENFSEQGAVY